VNKNKMERKIWKEKCAQKITSSNAFERVKKKKKRNPKLSFLTNRITAPQNGTSQ